MCRDVTLKIASVMRYLSHFLGGRGLFQHALGCRWRRVYGFP